MPGMFLVPHSHPREEMARPGIEQRVSEICISGDKGAEFIARTHAIGAEIICDCISTQRLPVVDRVTGSTWRGRPFCFPSPNQAASGAERLWVCGSEIAIRPGPEAFLTKWSAQGDMLLPADGTVPCAEVF